VRSMGLLLTAALCSCEAQDAWDQRQARRLCGLPGDAAVVAWQGYPGRVGFGQREGLHVAGTFRPPPTWTPGSAGYRAAPWPGARAAAERDFHAGEALEGAVMIRCESAGNDVLRAGRTRPCDAQPRNLDLILCAVDGAGQVRVTVRSAY
jgi:hypothetical protein